MINKIKDLKEDWTDENIKTVLDFVISWSNKKPVAFEIRFENGLTPIPKAGSCGIILSNFYEFIYFEILLKEQFLKLVNDILWTLKQLLTI